MSSSTTMPIWAAFCASQLVFAGVAWFLWAGVQPDNTLTVWVLGSMTAPLTLMSVFGAGFIAKDDARTRSILRWAFAESIAVFGVVCAMLGGPQWLGPAMAAWGFVLILIAFPR